MKKTRIFLVAGLLGLNIVWLLSASLVQAAPVFASFEFQRLWERTDKILEEQTGSGRGYVWGPNLLINSELYTEAPGGARIVQYFDKGRMELTRTGDTTSVTSGLLTKELVSGRQQNGSDVNNFSQFNPSEVQIAGDPNNTGRNQIAPVYRSFRNLATFNNDNGSAARLGQQIGQRVDKAGTVAPVVPPDSSVYYSLYNPTTRHNVASVFTQFGTNRGTVYNGFNYVQGPIFAPDATAVFGLPITEPYWVRAELGGSERDILVQLFERRVLTYTPSNAAADKVEMGNVGAHYYRWRYQDNPQPAPNPNPNPPNPDPLNGPQPSIDYSQARAIYNRSGAIPQGGVDNLSFFNVGSPLSRSYIYDPNLKLAIVGTGSGLVGVDLANFGQPGQRWRSNGARFAGGPTLFNGVIYAGDSGGTVYALREDSGALIWSQTVGGDISRAVVIDPDTAYVVSGDGRLSALNLSSGAIKWQMSMPGTSIINSPIITPRGTIIITTADRRVYSLLRDGSLAPGGVWNPPTLDGDITSTPAFGSNRVFATTSNGTLYGLNADGTVQSQKTFTPGKAIFTTPAVVDFGGGNVRVYVGSDDGRVYGVNASYVGDVRWTFTAVTNPPVRSSVAIVDGYVYFGSEDHKVYRVDARDASRVSVMMTAEDGFDTNSVIVNSGYVFIAPRSGNNLFIIK